MTKASGSFLKKRTKKLLALMVQVAHSLPLRPGSRTIPPGKGLRLGYFKEQMLNIIWR
jgi:hypothetical protein